MRSLIVLTVLIGCLLPSIGYSDIIPEEDYDDIVSTLEDTAIYVVPTVISYLMIRSGTRDQIYRKSWAAILIGNIVSVAGATWPDGDDKTRNQIYIAGSGIALSGIVSHIMMPDVSKNLSFDIGINKSSLNYSFKF